MVMATGCNTPRPPYIMANGLARCDGCKATWNPKCEFVHGYRSSKLRTDGENNFVECGRVTKGECPWCGKRITGANQ
jgi:hypothetical protein